MIRSGLFICFIMQTLAFTAQTQEPYTPQVSDPVLESWRWQNFPQLKGPGFRAVVEDAQGHMWFATDNGVKHYDGLTWTDYTVKDGLHGAPINVLCAAKDSSVYAGSRKGISQFKNGTWQRVFPLDPRVDWTIWSIREGNDGSIWSGTARGALCISPNGNLYYYTTKDCADGLQVIAPWMTYVIVPAEFVTAEQWGDGIGVKEALGLPPDGGPITGAVVRALAPNGPAERAGVRVGDRILSLEGKDSPPHLDIRGAPGTVSTLKLRHMDDTKIRQVNIVKETVTSTFRDFWVFDAYPDSKGAIWFAVRTGELIKYNGSKTSPTFERFDATDGLEVIGRRPGTKLAETPDGLLWLVTSTEGGLNRYDGVSWTTSKLANIDGSDQNTSISQSPNGTLWVGGESTLHKYQNGQWTVYQSPTAPIPEGNIIVYADQNHRLWVGGIGRGISNLDLGENLFQTYQELSFQFITEEGTQWYLSKDGHPVSLLKQWMRHAVPNTPAQISIVKLVPQKNNKVWAIGSKQGLVEVFENDQQHWQKITQIEIAGILNPKTVTVLRNGDLWFGSQTATYQYDGQKVHQYDITPIGAVNYDNTGTVWVADHSNLYKINGQKLEKLTHPEALSRTASQVILTTQNGYLWVGTTFFGLFQFDGTTWTRHDIQNGLPDNNITSIVEFPNGHIAIATPAGFSRYDGQVWTDYLKGMPNAQSGGLHVGRQGQHWINTAHYQTHLYTPTLCPPETKITVNLTQVSQPGNTILSWAGVDPWHTDKYPLMFSYQLNNNAWSPYTQQTNKTFLSLPSGKHTLKVRARDTDFYEDPSPAQLTFHVAPPIWREPWVIIPGLMLIFAGISQTIRIVQRDRQLQETNEDLQVARTDLERRVAQRTQELKETNAQLLQEAAEREKTAQALIHLERLRAVGEMSAGVSHNLNNMLTGILGPAQMIKELTKHPDGIFYIDTILTSAKRAKDLVERLHQAVRGHDRDTLYPVSVNQVVLDAIQTTRPRWKDEMEAQGIHITLQTQLGNVSDIQATQTGLHDVLVNLIFNAVDAMPSGGTITLITQAKQDQVIIRITDTGKGMDADTKKRLFEPFFTTKMNVGTGLGLFTVHNEVTRWQGAISVDSALEQGTTVTITVPTLQQSRNKPKLPKAAPLHLAPECKILVVDDEDIVRNVVLNELSKHHQVSAEINGPQALAAITSSPPNIALIDLGLPEMPGDELGKKIKSINPTIVTILMTGWRLDQGDHRRDPFDFYLQKPLDVNELYRTIADAAQLYETRNNTS